jgi:membrane protein implicated in regulation of membrane protease activity
MTGFEVIGKAGIFLILGVIAIRLFIKTDWKGKLQIAGALLALNSIVMNGWSGVFAVLLAIATTVAAVAIYKRWAKARQARKDEEIRRAGAIFSEEFFRKQEEARMRQNMRGVQVPKRIGEDDSEAIKKARENLIRRIK